MDDLLREAIADAKAVRETALENAKIALEEAFTPRLQSMLSKKIAAEAEGAEESEIEDEEMREQDAEENDHEEEEMREQDHEENDHEEEMREQDAEESDHEESEVDEEEAEESEVEEQDAEEMDAEESEAEESDHEEMRGMKEQEAEEDDSVEESEKEENEMEEDELDLESVLAELEKDLDDEDQVDEEYEENEVEDGMDSDEVDVEDDHLAENDVSSDIGKADNKVNPAANDSSKSGAPGPEGEGSDKKAGTELGDHEIVKEEEAEESDLDLDEVLRALTEEEAEEQDAEENEKLKAEIKEHRKVINFMRSKLNEVNLLNAKLLFSNKLFRAFGLNNNQKLKVVETFDRTKNLREVKLVYATLAESFKRPGNRISESVKKGSASKPVRSTKPKAVLSEGQELKARFKKLANIL